MKTNDEELRTVAPDGRPPSEQPAWRQEFPVDVPQDNYVSRRAFTKFLGLTSLAFVVGQFWILVQSWFRGRKEKPESRRIARLGDIPVGGSVTFFYPDESESCLLLRLPPGRQGGHEEDDVVLADGSRLAAFNQKCTHLSCAVVPELSTGCLHCPCHRGYFDAATGRPKAGPPRRPLPRVRLEIRRDDIYATGVEIRTV
jgi:Rieske Fe-S protein